MHLLLFRPESWCSSHIGCWWILLPGPRWHHHGGQAKVETLLLPPTCCSPLWLLAPKLPERYQVPIKSYTSPASEVVWPLLQRAPNPIHRCPTPPRPGPADMVPIQTALPLLPIRGHCQQLLCPEKPSHQEPQENRHGVPVHNQEDDSHTLDNL